MKQKIRQSTATVIIFSIDMALFILLTLPAKLWISSIEITEMRPSAALTPVLGVLYGWPAAVGCAAGNFLCDIICGYGASYALNSSLQQAVYAMTAYFLWRQLNRERDGKQFRLDSVSRVLKFVLLLAANAMLTVICTAILNRRYDVANLISMDNLYIFINSFDSGLLFGMPILILGRLLRTYLENLKTGKQEKIIQFSIGERMILNNILMGLCVCLLVGLAVYLTDRYSSYNGISVWGRMYLFETLTLNVYFALSVGFLHFTEEKISRPIEELAQIAGNYYTDSATDYQRTRMVDACRTYAKETTEAGDLARSYIAMAQDLDNYMDNLKSVMAEKERINAELSVASDIQAHMLPCIFPPFPAHSEFELYATMHPAKEVGGDFYDFFMVGEEKLALVVADVSGKGVPAALFMVIAKTLIKNYAQTGAEPAKVFTLCNRILCDGNDAGMFVTAWMGILELSSGTLTYVNAGHNPPLLKRANGEFNYLRNRTGFILAGMENTTYRQNSLIMTPGDRLFLYTDGVTESMDATGQLYGETRLQTFLNQHSDSGTTDLLKELQGELHTFSEGVPQFDDVTMLLLDFRGHQPPTAERTFPAQKNRVPEALAFVENVLENVHCSAKQQTALCVAIEEIFVNIASYAYPDEIGYVRISILTNKATDTVIFRITDSGIPFNPLEHTAPDITLPAAQRDVGGLGIFIVRKTMDQIEYIRENGKNCLTMTKKLERSGKS